jgi:hypothetical protein
LGEGVHALLARGLGSLRAEAEHRHAGRGFADLSEEKADASLHVTNGGFNSMLTVMANAFHVAGGILYAS